MNCPRSCTVQVRYLNARLGPFRTHAPAEQVQWQRGMNVGQGLNRGVIASHVFMGGGNRTTKVPVGSHSNTFGYSLPRSETSRPFRTVLTSTNRDLRPTWFFRDGRHFQTYVTYFIMGAAPLTECGSSFSLTSSKSNSTGQCPSPSTTRSLSTSRSTSSPCAYSPTLPSPHIDAGGMVPQPAPEDLGGG